MSLGVWFGGCGVGGVKKVYFRCGWVGSVMWWMWCGGGSVKKVYFRCGWVWQCGVVDVVLVGVKKVYFRCGLGCECGGGGGGVKNVYFRGGLGNLGWGWCYLCSFFCCYTIFLLCLRCKM